MVLGGRDAIGCLLCARIALFEHGQRFAAPQI